MASRCCTHLLRTGEPYFDHTRLSYKLSSLEHKSRPNLISRYEVGIELIKNAEKYPFLSKSIWHLTVSVCNSYRKSFSHSESENVSSNQGVLCDKALFSTYILKCLKNSPLYLISIPCTAYYRDRVAPSFGKNWQHCFIFSLENSPNWNQTLLRLSKQFRGCLHLRDQLQLYIFQAL